MFDLDWVSELDGDTACDAVAAAHRDLMEVECRQLVLAAHWIDLHAPADEPDGHERGALPGLERTVRVGADGTPEIGEFACAEFAALQDMHPMAGASLLRKVANLRDRHPLLWTRVRRGEVRGWKALEVARIVGKEDYTLSLEQARWVDAQTHEWIDTLPWGQFLDLVEARIIACDPEAAEVRRKEAESRRYVSVGRANEHGLKTLIAQARAGDVLRLVALCDRIAEILEARGDKDPVAARRATALGILANPAQALALLLGARASGDGRADGSDDPHGVPDPREGPHDHGEPDQPAGDDPTAFVRPLPKDLGALVPRGMLYIHLTQRAFETGEGVGRMEGVGPVTVGQVRRFLRHSKVTPVRVIDVDARRPVDGYEFPSSLREAALLTSPRDVFPWGTSTGRRKDLDHATPYLSPARGGPPGQTRTDNAAPMVRFHHRLKTHGGWGVRQPEPGTHLWRSPHGHFWLTTHTGTHPLSKTVGQMLWAALATSASRAG